MRRLFLILMGVVFGWLVTVQAAASTPTGKPGADIVKTPLSVTAGLTEAQRQKNIESFETVWKTIRDYHYDPKLGGLDWQGIHDDLLPRIEEAESMSDARSVMRDMLNRLGHSHVAIFPAIAIFVTVLAFNLLGDGLRDALDPKIERR